VGLEVAGGAEPLPAVGAGVRLLACNNNNS
jgi:hypothetical protein